MTWLTTDLKKEVRKVFEPRYGRELTDEEVNRIADNLTGYMEAILKFRYKTEYEKKDKKYA